VIKSADWLIDMGPEGGFRGGTVVAEGAPELVATVPESHTGRYLAKILDPEAMAVATAPKKRIRKKAS
jgi:excinuclease ABC subunit A